ncbi:hypothetical protein FTX61_13965 [Nitriliruptoraceae bacterium ZYF776]|nr:hypothetical protein [Profundirhabdus halotolerans]
MEDEANVHVAPHERPANDQAGCPTRGGRATGILASRSTERPSDLSGATTLDTPVGSARVATSETGDGMLRIYEFAEVDLRLEFHHLEFAPDLDQRILDTLRRPGSS